MDRHTSSGKLDQIFKDVLKGIPDEMQTCIENCALCSQACEQTLQHCLEMGDKHAHPSHIRLLQDCAEICETAAKFMIRKSDLHGKMCEICADVCELCAEDCERIDSHDETMKMCADLCRRCVESCRQMASHH